MQELYIKIGTLHVSTRTGTDRGVVSTSKWSESVWLVAPLVAKLPAAVQGRVLKQAGQVSGIFSS